MKERANLEQRTSSGQNPEAEVEMEVEEGEIHGEYHTAPEETKQKNHSPSIQSPPVQNPNRSRGRPESHWPVRRSGMSSSRRRMDRREMQEIFEELESVTKRLSAPEMMKSVEGCCRDLKNGVKKLDKIRRIMKWRSELDFRDNRGMIEYRQKIMTALHKLHQLFGSDSHKAQSVTLVQQLMRTIMNYRHVLLSRSQKRDVEEWTKQSVLYSSEEAKGIEEVKDQDEVKECLGDENVRRELRVSLTVQGSNEKSPSGSNAGPAVLTMAANLNTKDEEDGQSKVAVKEDRLNEAIGMEHVESIDAKQKSVQQGIQLSERRKRSLEEKELIDNGVGSNVRSISAINVEESVLKKKEESLLGSHEESKRQKSKSEDMEIEIEKESTAGEASITSSQKTQHSTLNEGPNAVTILPTSHPMSLDGREAGIPHYSLSTMEYAAHVHFHQGRSVCCDPYSYCAWPQRVPHDREGLNRKRQLRELKEQQELENHSDLNPLSGSTSPHKALEISGTVNEASSIDALNDSPLVDMASIPPPPPPIVFKPKPISPDVIFESPVDSYWDDLLTNLQFPKPHHLANKDDIREPLLEGRLCLVLDLDSVLFSTTKFMELDTESNQLLMTCVESEARLPLFARTLHRIEALQIWVKLRPGLNKFLRIARNAFWIYGHTTRSREEIEMILKLIDPEDCFLGNRIIYQERAPGECLFKKVKSLGSALKNFASITFILDDGCLSWEDHSAVCGIESYLFFPESKVRYGLTSKSMFETKTDEEDCGFLMNALDILLQFRQESFWLISNPDKFTTEEVSSKIPTWVSALESWDVRRIMSEARIQLFEDMVVVFDRILDPDIPKENQMLWRMAAAMGAECFTIISETTTHLVSLSSKESTKYKVVSPTWIEASYSLWMRLNEEHYRLP